jgi:hypothetical protein
LTSNLSVVKPILALSTYEALALMAHRVAVSERERVDMQATFLDAFGADEEKTRLYTESQADKDARIERERFDAAVSKEVQARQFASEQEKAVQIAADKSIADAADKAAVAARGTAQAASTTDAATEAHAQQVADSQVVVNPAPVIAP